MTQFVTRPYRYANGVAYRPNLKCIHPLERDGTPATRIVGGLIACKDKYLAFAADRGAVHLLQGRIDNVMRDAKAYAWGSTKTEALTAIRDHLSC